MGAAPIPDDDKNKDQILSTQPSANEPHEQLHVF